MADHIHKCTVVVFIFTGTINLALCGFGSSLHFCFVVFHFMPFKCQTIDLQENRYTTTTSSILLVPGSIISTSELI